LCFISEIKYRTQRTGRAAPSHHGKLEFGSPVKPLTLEAEILHFADDASAKTASISEAYASREFFPEGAGVSTKKIWQLDGRWMFKTKASFGRDTGA